ncbi:DUF898 family protein [Aminobacter sp. HY435]|uniref:DUF898 family protein n=1 Tax=Aminobacter sp. HY435 TaxID=2970917 RepID=UPI0022B9C16B|nr:DUF898 family protein [Aminobacter sp. HY435]
MPTQYEYFGTWSTDSSSTMPNLCIYSALVKVGRQRYFYGNTHLADATFGYHPHPWRILIRRITVIAMLVRSTAATDWARRHWQRTALALDAT